MSLKNNLSTKIIIMVEIIILISSSLFCAVSVYRSRVGIRKAIQQRMLDIANCAAGSISGDALKGINEDTLGSAEYESIYNTLAVFRDNVELEYVYSIRESGKDNYIFVMDLDPVSPASYGYGAEYTEALASAGRGIAAVDETPYSDEWGDFYSAYSPVFGSDGEVAGIVAVDFSVEWFEDQLSAQTRSTVTGYIIILIISLLVAAALSLTTVRPFVEMQGQLFEEKVRAESANQAKSDFLANMSHEVRTPINAMLGMNEMIIREDQKALEISSDPNAVRESLDNIGAYATDVKKAGNNLLAIVNDILDFSKIEAGRLDLVEAPYKLSSMLNDINNMIIFKAQEKDLKFSMDVDPEIPDALAGDEVRVRQVLTNLLNNAVKYTEKGSVRFSIRGEKQSDGFLLLTVSVSDTGIGIKPKDKEKLFSKFSRLEMEKNSTVEGTGLGLVITKRILDMMGGSITLESEYGKGSVFTVTMLQRILSDAPLGNFRERFEASIRSRSNYHESFRAPSAHILIVDDTRMNLTVAEKLLKKTQIRIDTSTCGADSVSKAANTSYDLILMDQRMPGMDGTEALHKIRETENGANTKTPIICFTADAVIGAKERYISEGFTDYMTKPIDSYTLERMLMNYLPAEKIERVREAVNSPAASSQIAATDAAGGANSSAVKNEGVEKSDPEQDTASGVDPELFAELRIVGVDVEVGLGYCQNDAEFYMTIIEEYLRSSVEKNEKLTSDLASGDWNDYGIYVHALKSTSKMIGAFALSEQAADLEAAASAGNAEKIRSEHDSMMSKYKVITDTIARFMPDVLADGSVSGDDEILEFFPEGDGN